MACQSYLWAVSLTCGLSVLPEGCQSYLRAVSLTCGLSVLPEGCQSYLWVVHEVFEGARGCVKDEITSHKMAADFILLKVKEAAPSLIPVPVGHCAPCVIAPGVTWGAPSFLVSVGGTIWKIQ